MRWNQAPVRFSRGGCGRKGTHSNIHIYTIIAAIEHVQMNIST
jgi:hypothetical protein